MKQTVGFALCGSFCTYRNAIDALRRLAEDYTVVPIFSGAGYTIDSRFGTAADFVAEVETICGVKALHTIAEVEPQGTVNHVYKGITYNPTPQTVTIKVDDDGAGALVVNAKKSKLTVSASNTYKAAPTTEKVKVTKELSGREWTDTDSFEFTLAATSNPNDGAKLPSVLTANATKAAKTAEFGDITFSKPGTYVFTITETEGKKPCS